VGRVALSPEGRRLSAAALDGTVWLWDLESGLPRVLSGHAAEAFVVAFSSDGRALLSASMDGSVRLWADDLPFDEAGLRGWLTAVTPEVIRPGEGEGILLK
jgi:eukaryotic-like serine/threonine-protein kinase